MQPLEISTLNTEQPSDNMSTRGRSASPRSRDVDVDMERQSDERPDAKFIVITNLTRNVVDTHLQSIFAFYGEVVKIDLPTYVKCVYRILGSTPPSDPILFFSFSLQRVKTKGKPPWNMRTRPPLERPCLT